MAVDFEALRKELNVYMGKKADCDGVEVFPVYDPMNSDTLIGYVFGRYAIPKEALNKGMLLKLAAEKLEDHLTKGAGYLAILKRHAAGVEALCDSVVPCDCPSEAEASSAERKR